MKLIGLIFLLTLSACVTAPKEEQVSLPLPDATSPKISYIKEASKTKTRIGEAGSNVFDFYYGPKGSYFIVISTTKLPYTFDLNDYDATLLINSLNEVSPEVLSLSSEDPQVLSGFGNVREGSTVFELQLTPVDQALARPINFKFKLDIKSFL